MVQEEGLWRCLSAWFFFFIEQGCVRSEVKQGKGVPTDQRFAQVYRIFEKTSKHYSWAVDNSYERESLSTHHEALRGQAP